MPRFAALVVVGFFNAVVAPGCWFSADYRSGNVACRDGKCPSGLSCVAEVCVAASGDGGGSDVHDASVADAKRDAAEAALTCADPGTFVADNTVTGTTAGRANTISASCNGTVMNGADAVYKIAGTIGQHLTLTPHSSAYPITAYAITPCTTSGVPACTGNAYATDASPVTITIPATTDYFIIVDGGNAALSGAYTLTVALN
ncbi:MAG TPA: hypothetical protein VIV58_33870 [Kofleriaceae bacterium]